MKPPLYVRPLTDAGRDDLKAKLHSSDAFTLRRSQILLASACGKRPREIGEETGCASQTVRNAIRAFNERGLAALQEGSHCPHTASATFDAARRGQLQALAHRSPRDFGHPTSLWTLPLLGQESARQGITPRPVSKETVRLVEQSVAQDDPDPKALAAYGLLVCYADGQPEEVWLRFCAGRPASAITTQFLADGCTTLAARGKRVLLLIWDNASWNISKWVTGWIREHNHEVRRTGQGVRIHACPLPVMAPWLNPIEPKWVHGKRAVVEPDRLLPAIELEERICAHFRCHPQDHLIAQPAA